MPLNKVPARFAPEVLRDYWRNRALAVLGLAIVALLCWLAWEFLPRGGAQLVSATGTVRDLRKGWRPSSKYTLVQAPIAVIDVMLPGGGTQQFTGDVRLLDRCRRGDPVRLARQENNLGQSSWIMIADSCGVTR